VPYARPAPRAHPRAATTTTEPGLNPPPANVAFDFPLGDRRGRVYLTCRNTFFSPQSNDAGISGLFRDDFRAVWAIHV
jgi:hypothetical protein